MEYRDYYRTLGVKKDATADEIRRAYRSLARKHHPDVNPNDPEAEERFKQLNEAYEVLKDTDKRAKYDRFGSDWNRYQQAGDAGGFDWSQWYSGASGGPRMNQEYVDLNDLFGSAGAAGGSGFSDFFEFLFSGGSPGGGRTSGRGGQRRGFRSIGQNVEQPVTVTLEEAYSGTQRLVQSGQRRLEIKIPPGVQTGSRVRIAGAGQPGMSGGKAGDLFLVVTVHEHPRFTREGDNLRLEQAVDLYDMILGGEALIETLNGRLSLRIPESTPSGKVFRLRGKGMPVMQNAEKHGDLLVKVYAQVPESLSDKEREMFQRLADLRK